MIDSVRGAVVKLGKVLPVVVFEGIDHFGAVFQVIDEELELCFFALLHLFHKLFDRRAAALTVQATQHLEHAPAGGTPAHGSGCATASP